MPNQQPSAERRASVDPASPVRPHAAAPRAAEKSSLDTVGHTSGSVTNGPRPSARARDGRGSSFAPCGHSACRQNWIDTGEVECVADESHTGAATTKSEKAPIGQGRAHSSLALDDDGPRSGMGAVCWAVGAILCVAVFPALYLLIAACMGAL